MARAVACGAYVAPNNTVRLHAGCVTETQRQSEGKARGRPTPHETVTVSCDLAARPQAARWPRRKAAAPFTFGIDGARRRCPYPRSPASSAVGPLHGDGRAGRPGARGRKGSTRLGATPHQPSTSVPTRCAPFVRAVHARLDLERCGTRNAGRVRVQSSSTASDSPQCNV